MEKEIHFTLTTASETAKIDELNLLDITVFRLNPVLINRNVATGKKIVEALGHSKQLAVINDVDFANEIGATAIFFTSQTRAVEWDKADYSHLKIGGLAHNMADCKNWELLEIDYIDLLPSQSKKDELPTILGNEIYHALQPQDETYGWMILSLNTSVLATGFNSIDELIAIVKESNVSGVSITASDLPKLSIIEKVTQINKVLRQ